MQFDERLRNQKEAIGSDFDKALQVFIADRKRMGCAPRTIEWYEEVLGGYFRDYLEEHNMPLEPSRWIVSDIEDYMDYLIHERNCKPVTCKSRFSSIRAWCNFLLKKGYITENPVAGIAPMIIKKEMPKTINESDLDRVLKKPSLNNCTFADFRDWAIVWTLFDTGVRIKELCNIKIADLHLDEGYIVITHGKMQKERPVAISKTLLKVLEEFLDVRQGNSDDYVFCNSYGKKIHPSTIRKRMNEYGKRLGITDFSLSPHKFRYTFAKHYIKNGGDPFRLQKMLGHSSMEMVRHYVQMFSDDVIEAHQQFSPADNFVKKEEAKKAVKEQRIKMNRNKK